jgi:hypothetical protein
MAPIGVDTGGGEGQKPFLEIVQDAAQECRIVVNRGQRLPTTVLNQTGILNDFVYWTSEAWLEIQRLHNNWRFLRRTTTFELVDGQQEYTSAECGVDLGTFGSWVLNSFRCFNTAAGLGSEQFLSAYDSYDEWRDTFQYGNLRTAKSRPMAVTELPTRGLGFALTPSVGYSATGQYYLAPQRLEADEDIPILPIKHSTRIIVYKVMETYGLATPAPEILALGQTGYRKLLAQLEADQLPKMQFAGAMA